MNRNELSNQAASVDAPIVLQFAVVRHWRRAPAQRVRGMSRVAIIAFLLASLSPALSVSECAKWSWSRELPSAVAAVVPVTNRTPAAVDSLFSHGSPPLSIDKVLAKLGRPDGFSPQSLYSLTQGSAQPQKVGGTLRFLLTDGGELHIRTSDFHLIYEAIRYEKSGRGNLLAK
jgi:hypothetical protein